MLYYLHVGISPTFSTGKLLLCSAYKPELDRKRQVELSSIFPWLLLRQWREIPGFHPSIYTSRAICSHFNFWTKLSHVNGLRSSQSYAMPCHLKLCYATDQDRERVGRTLSHVKKKAKKKQRGWTDLTALRLQIPTIVRLSPHPIPSFLSSPARFTQTQFIVLFS